MKITFDDWIFMQDDKVAINRATITKFGINFFEFLLVLNLNKNIYYKVKF